MDEKEAFEKMRKLRTVLSPFPDPIPTASEWISVKDRLPEIERGVLVWVINGADIFSEKEYTAVDWLMPDTGFQTSALGFGEVTHWMPLPEPPR